jgi:hypothetical protein
MNRVHAGKIAAVSNVDEPNRVTTHALSEYKITVPYIPFNGDKSLTLGTYNSLTGRAAKNTVQPIKWKASAVINNRAYYGNIDFKDDQDQTLREKNRIMFTDAFKMDEATVGLKYIDVGRNDGDEIMALHNINDRLYVLKKRNVYVYRVRGGVTSNQFLEAHHYGIGCIHKYASTQTPYGLCFFNTQKVILMRGNEPIEISFKIRAEFQALKSAMITGALQGQASLGYDAIRNELVLNHTEAESNWNSTSLGRKVYVYNFDTTAWTTWDYIGVESEGNYAGLQDLSVSNVVLDDEGHAQFISKLISSPFTIAMVRSYNVGTICTQAGLVKTKNFDFGLPDQYKRITKFHITFKCSGSVTLNFYVDGSGSVTKAITLTSNPSITITETIPINLLCKYISIEISAPNTDYELEGFDVDYSIEGNNP